MVNAVQPLPSPRPVAATEAQAPVRRASPAAASPDAVVSVSDQGLRAASTNDWAKRLTGTIHTTADTNQDGTVSDQEQQTEAAKLALRKATLEGGANLEEAMQAYQAIASLADVQR
ncbi:MAG: hypothetical protein ACK44A_08950 [Roseateles sp.]